MHRVHLIGLHQSPVGYVVQFEPSEEGFLAAGDQGFLDAVQESGASDLYCARSEVSAHKEAEGVFSATGCGKHVQYTAERGDGPGIWELKRKIQATDGNVYRDDTDATRASGAHDLHCAARIVPRALYDNPSHKLGTGLVLLADGCGQRATYKLDAHAALVLVSIVKVDPPSVPPVATATATP